MLRSAVVDAGAVVQYTMRNAGSRKKTRTEWYILRLIHGRVAQLVERSLRKITGLINASSLFFTGLRKVLGSIPSSSKGDSDLGLV